MTVDPAVLTELARLRQRLPELSGRVLATTDGMVVAHDAHDLDPETLAAMSAAHLGLARRFAMAVAHGQLHETVVSCAGGYITTYAAGEHALLTLVTTDRANLARVNQEARRTVARLGDVLPTAPLSAPPDTPSAVPPRQPGGPTDVPPQRSGGAPALTRRQPMAAILRNFRQQHAG
ncbi:MAG TPA: roadblock/LC7 domain-containing protein [Pilimelia sp.]|nr:roadblock/LC7 domain-containing protein [Pilimelia sp.]